MIQVRMSVADLGRTRFAYSPLTECGESLYMLSSGTIRPVHRKWFESVQARLRQVDLELLCAVTPATGWIASYYLSWANGPDTRMEDQLTRFAELPGELVAAKVAKVWNGQAVPERASELLQSDGVRKLADALWSYWQAAIEPHWATIRAVLDEDVAHRARMLSTGGMQPLLAGLHDQVRWEDQLMLIGEKEFDDRDAEATSGAGMLLVPSVFAWPDVVFHVDDDSRANLIYPARGIGNLWGAAPEDPDGPALGALLGQSRAEILLALDVPRSTSELAALLGQSPASVSQHLSVLRRSAMATSWRAGRKVLYVRTDLAASVVQANSRTAEQATGA